MANTLTLEFEDDNGCRKVIDHAVDSHRARYTRGRKITLRIGIEFVTVTEREFVELWKTLDAASSSDTASDWLNIIRETPHA